MERPTNRCVVDHLPEEPNSTSPGDSLREHDGERAVLKYGRLPHVGAEDRHGAMPAHAHNIDLGDALRHCGLRNESASERMPGEVPSKVGAIRNALDEFGDGPPGDAALGERLFHAVSGEREGAEERPALDLGRLDPCLHGASSAKVGA
jgi:hypothetical protein